MTCAVSPSEGPEGDTVIRVCYREAKVPSPIDEEEVAAHAGGLICTYAPEQATQEDKPGADGMHQKFAAQTADAGTHPWSGWMSVKQAGANILQ